MSKVRRQSGGDDCNRTSIVPTLSPAEQVVEREIEADPDVSNREIARRVGADESVVRRTRKKLGLPAKPASGSTPVLVSAPPDLAEQIIKVFGADRLALIEACQHVIKTLEEERF